MASLINKDSYLQKLAKKIYAQESCEPQKRKFGGRLGDDGTQPKKKKKRKKLRYKNSDERVGAPLDKQMPPEIRHVSFARPTQPAIKKSESNPSNSTVAEGKESGIPGAQNASGSFSAMKLLRQRLHEKIQEVSGQGSSKDLSPAVLAKRQRRKFERERKKRRRKELRMKEKMKKEEADEAVLDNEAQKNDDDDKAEIVFNKVEVHEEQELSRIEKRREKRKAVKGNLTPLTGKNYKQLLNRLEARKNKLEDLKEKDSEKAKELETKMKWTNVLYKAEGIKIRDDEDRLKAALKHKEKRKAQRQKQWEKRTEHVAEKMQQRQDKRRRNLQKKKLTKVEKKKARARKKGRVLPGDLEKAGFK